MFRPKYKFAAGQLCMTCIHRSVSPLMLQNERRTCRFESETENVGPGVLH
jgi:hypothetical protein